MAGVLARERDARVVADERFRANTAMSLVRGDVVGGPVVRSSWVLEGFEGIVHAGSVGRIHGGFGDARGGLCGVCGDHRCGIHVGGNVLGDALGNEVERARDVCLNVIDLYRWDLGQVAWEAVFVFVVVPLWALHASVPSGVDPYRGVRCQGAALGGGPS